MGNLIDLTGQSFGRLKVIKRASKHKSSDGHAYWICLCTCGNITEVRGSLLRTKKTKSCGCAAIENLKKEATRIAFERSNATHCAKGHEFTKENTILLKWGNGKRHCRTCRNEYNRSEKGKEIKRKYRQSERGRKIHNKLQREQYHKPGTYKYEHLNPNGKFYGETLRQKRERRADKQNQKDKEKLWQLQN